MRVLTIWLNKLRDFVGRAMMIVSILGISVPSVKISPNKRPDHLSSSMLDITGGSAYSQLTSTGNSCARNASIRAFRSRSCVFEETHRASTPRCLNASVRASTWIRSTQNTNVDLRPAMIKRISQREVRDRRMS